MEIQTAMLRNVLLGHVDGQKFEIKYENGYIVFDWGGGKTTRMRRAANGWDSLIPLPDGKELRLKPDYTLLAT